MGPECADRRRQSKEREGDRRADDLLMRGGAAMDFEPKQQIHQSHQRKMRPIDDDGIAVGRRADETWKARRDRDQDDQKEKDEIEPDLAPVRRAGHRQALVMAYPIARRNGEAENDSDKFAAHL